MFCILNSFYYFCKAIEQDIIKRLTIMTAKNKILKYLLLTTALVLFSISQSSCEDFPFLEKKCEATTKKGEPCQYKAAKNSKYCRIHRKKTRTKSKYSTGKKCKAKTQNGTRCTRKANRSGYCKQHYRTHSRR